ncbi:unnamed protein product, partial [Brenthis ino]
MSYKYPEYYRPIEFYDFLESNQLAIFKKIEDSKNVSEHKVQSVRRRADATATGAALVHVILIVFQPYKVELSPSSVGGFAFIHFRDRRVSSSI